MIVLAADVQTDKHNTEGRGSGAWVWIVDLWRDSSNVTRKTSNNQDIVFAGNTYTQDQLIVTPGGSDCSGTIKPFTVTISNIDLSQSTYYEAGKYTGMPAIARYVNTAHLSSVAYAARTLRGKIQQPSYDETSISFVCGSRDPRSVQTPGNRCNRLRCRCLAFKDFECKYAGVDTSCDRSLADCLLKANEANFGGFPAIPLEHL